MNDKVIEYKGQRILMTHQLAESYETDSKNLNDNYKNNISRYKEGKHFFELRGDELREFKASLKISGNLKYAPVIQLWTEKGAWLQAKSLNTDKAWEAYELLVDDYYQLKQFPQLVTPSYMIEDPIKRAEIWIEELKEKKVLELQNSALQKHVEETAPKIAYMETILNSKGTVTTTQIAKDYGLRANDLNEIMKDEGIQYKVNNQWILKRKYDDKGYTQSYSFNFTHKDGTPDVKMNTRWTQRGRLFIHKLLTELGYKANIDKEYTDAK